MKKRFLRWKFSRKSVLIILVAVVYLGAVFVWLLAPGQQEGQDSWRQFKSMEGRFSVTFPQSPQVTQNCETHVCLTYSSTAEDGTVYFAGFDDEPMTFTNADLAGELKDTVALTGGQLIASRVTSFKGYFAMDGTIKRSIFGNTKIRLFLVGHRLYILGVDVKRTNVTQVDRFYSSFKLL